MIIDSRSPKYISVPVIIKSEPARIIRYLPVQRLQTPLRDSQNTSLTLSLTNDKNVSHSTELSHLSTFYQSTEAEVKKFSWDTFRNSVQQLKQQAKENNFPLTKINSFHLGNKYRSNKIQRTSKPVITTSKENLQQISQPEHQKSPETRRKSNSIMIKNMDVEYSYRRDINKSFFHSTDSDTSMLTKQRSLSHRQATQQKQIALKTLIDSAIAFVQLQQGVPQKLKKQTKIIIDTDAGGDDTHAILTALTLADQYGVEIIGITLLNGCTTTNVGVKNVRIAQHLAKKRVPVYVGCDRNLKQQLTLNSGFFDQDGLSGYQQKYIDELQITEEFLKPDEGHAVDFLIESSEKYKDDLRVICIGPLTNIACAMIKSTHFEQNVGSLICLTGNILGLGCVNKGTAEYNMYTDPEAAHLVFKVLFEKLVIIPYESMVTLSQLIAQKIFANEATEKGRFVKNINQGFITHNNRYDLQDPLCVIIALEPKVVTEYVERPCEVVLTTGQLNVRWQDQGQNILFILRVDETLIMNLLQKVVE